MRINKYIASSGLCSRRKAEEYIEKGQVTINGITATLSSTVEDNDMVLLNGKPIEKKNDYVVLLFNKPKGITCTTELKVKGNIIDYINYPERIFPIGRLDKDSTGLILLTNNGDLVNECLRVENRHEKEYIVKVNKTITNDRNFDTHCYNLGFSETQIQYIMGHEIKDKRFRRCDLIDGDYLIEMYNLLEQIPINKYYYGDLTIAQ